MAFIIIISALIIFCFSPGMETNILLHPKSRIAPVGTEVDYYCKISDGVNPHWVIDDFAYDHENALMSSQGFLFEKEESMSMTTLTLRVNVTADKNGTEVYCSSLDTHSDIALLIAISELPVSPNPSIENPTASTMSFLLKWSPPYLWPGHSIDYYQITVSKTDGSGNILQNARNFVVNATFSDTIITFILDANLTVGADLEWPFSSVYVFGISAVSIDYIDNDKSELDQFFIVGRYLPGTAMEECMPVITQSHCNSTLKPCGMHPMEESDIKVLMGSLLGIVLLVSIVLAVILLVCIYTHLRRQRGRTMNNADFNEMVLNPIYDGPMYETILKVDNLKEQSSCHLQQTHIETNLAVDFSPSCCDDNDISKCLKGENKTEKTEQNFQLSIDKVYTMSPTLTSDD